MKYIALLRGVNVGGNNKIAMSELRDCFEELGFSAVTSYINSGNVIFESTETNSAKLVRLCEGAIEKRFGFRVVCAVILADDLLAALDHAPSWWNQDDMSKHNAIFVIAPLSVTEIMTAVGEAKPDYEKVAAYQPVIFWSAPIKTFGRTRYSKIVGSSVYKSITIRNARTTIKLAELCR